MYHLFAKVSRRCAKEFRDTQGGFGTKLGQNSKADGTKIDHQILIRFCLRRGRPILLKIAFRYLKREIFFFDGDENILLIREDTK